MSSAEDTHNNTDNEQGGETRRDFLYLTASAVGGLGVAASLWPFLNSMNPAADTLALATTEVNLSPIEPGQAITVKWRGQPVFIRHRTEKEIQEARSVELADLRDKQMDEDRVKDGKAQWLIMVGICTHLGCVPLGQKPGEAKGDYGGWFCPCHGSHYDNSGRIRKGPAPSNLVIPPYEFVSEQKIKIG